MRNYILNRYEKDEFGNLIISIYTEKIEDLYEFYDKKSSFIKKDLNEKLEEYLFECVDEIGSEPFIIQFFLEEKINQDSEKKLKTNINEYFSYLKFLEKKKMQENLKNSIIFSLIGFIFIFISFNFSENKNILLKIISEGFTIGGWVALWEALVTILVSWLPLNKNMNIYKKIASAKIKVFY